MRRYFFEFRTKMSVAAESEDEARAEIEQLYLLPASGYLELIDVADA